MFNDSTTEFPTLNIFMNYLPIYLHSLLIVYKWLIVIGLIYGFSFFDIM